MFWNRVDKAAPEPPRGRPQLAPVVTVEAGTLSLRGVSKSYAIDGTPRPVLSDIDLDIAPGEFVAIVGPSGCGKSTLLRLISGLDTDYEGDILLDGRRIAGPSLDRSMVFQDHRLFPWLTVTQNVGLALSNSALSKADKASAVAAHLNLVNLAGFANAYPHQLSGGMAQRAAIARGLVNEPRLLLLDEPLGALDALTRLNLRTELERIWMRQRSTMIMVTHDVAEAAHVANRVIVMAANPGRIVEIIEVEALRPRDRSALQLRRVEDRLLSLILEQDDPQR